MSDLAHSLLLKNNCDQTLPIGKRAYRSCLAASKFYWIFCLMPKKINMCFIWIILAKLDHKTLSLTILINILIFLLVIRQKRDRFKSFLIYFI